MFLAPLLKHAMKEKRAKADKMATYSFIIGLMTTDDGKRVKGWFHPSGESYILKPSSVGAAVFPSPEYAKEFVQSLRSSTDPEVASAAKLLSVQPFVPTKVIRAAARRRK